MKHAMLLAPAVVLAAGFFATPSQAHGGVVVGVGLPPVVIDTGAVVVTLGPPPPPPPAPVVVVHQPPPPTRVVYVREPPPPRSTVVVYTRERERVVYVDPCDHGRDVAVIHHGDHRGGPKHDGRHDNGKHRGNGNKHRGYDR